MTNTMTKRDYFNMIKDAMSDNADVVAFCDHEIELLSKKAAKAKTAPKKVDTPRLNKLVADGRAVKGTVKVEKAKRTTYALA